MCKSAQVVEITRCGELPHCACHQVDVVGEVLREAADSELLARLGVSQSWGAHQPQGPPYFKSTCTEGQAPGKPEKQWKMQETCEGGLGAPLQVLIRGLPRADAPDPEQQRRSARNSPLACSLAKPPIEPARLSFFLSERLNHNQCCFKTGWKQSRRFCSATGLPPSSLSLTSLF